MNHPSFPSISTLCFSFLSVGLLATPAHAAPIDRQAVVSRQDVHVRQVDPESALSVGNGDFAFTADVTGLQSLSELYFQRGIPLETLSTWAWHSFPNPSGLKLEDTMKPYDFHGRKVPYASQQNSPAGKYFRENPHPIPLGQISLLYQGRALTPEDLGAIDQRLDLWTGIIHSSYTIAGQPVTVETVAHPELSAMAVKLKSPLVKKGDLQVRFRFPYSHKYSSDEQGARNNPPYIWEPNRHRTEVSSRSAGFAQLTRTLDDSRYYVNVAWQGTGELIETAPHDFRLQASANDTLVLTVAFTADAAPTRGPSFADTRAASAQGWKDYWTRGGIVDLAGSTDPRAAELERRIVLSQYLMKVNYAGNVPPSETGLTQISWFGKHNSEMYFWHAAQFYQWGHPELLEKGLAWYRKILPIGQAAAKEQGFDGVRWPKMTGPDGRPGPGSINPFIIWNQPNPIYLSELVYRAHPDRATLEKYREIVFESAKFLASFAFYDDATGRYVLGPPIKNVSEKAVANTTQNPTFELAYWYYGLQVAQTWRARLGLEPEPHWADILQKLSKLPVSDGKYLEIETEPNLYTNSRGGLPTTMMLSLGYLPKTDFVDLETARRTFAEINRRNGPDRWVSWQLGQGALSAARLGEPGLAVHMLTNASAATRFMPSGHVRRPKEPNGCVTYLPVNSSLLAAAGLMIAGWDGAPKVNAPGFPQDGTWSVKWEGLNPMP
ncbi:MAG TPA: hypothetical protein VMC06_00240 [Opitutaceae bacterium]|nr:hypothetical protein [Opitutaceae bacterium]